LAKTGDVWRILGRGTLVDVIKLSFFYFQKEKTENHLVEIFNNSMKVKLLSRIKAIEVKGDLEDMLKKFDKEPDFILQQYDIIFRELQPTFKNYTTTNLYDLNGKIQYSKVINQLEIDSYADDIFEEIIGITYNILLTENSK
jgi:uncharacterized protein (DUF1015 family)